MYGMMLASIEVMPSLKQAKYQLQNVALKLEKMTSIPQVKSRLGIIKSINTDEFRATNDILAFERIRCELRELIKFLEKDGKDPVMTNLTDPILSETEGVSMPQPYDFEDYRKKVNRYVEENSDSLTIYKLTHNLPLKASDFQELEQVLTYELGSREDYEREFGDTPFGLLIRKIAKLNFEAAMLAFAHFINDQSLNHNQIEFVKKVINHVVQNGYMDELVELTKPPFDKPISFVKLFDPGRQAQLMAILRQIKDNAVNVVA